MAALGIVGADVVRLKDGNVLEGEVIKQDGAQITMTVGGQPVFVSASDVAAVEYARPRLVVPAEHPEEAPPAIDHPLLDVLRDRLRAFRRSSWHGRRAASHLWRRDEVGAARDVRRAVQALLPLRYGALDPLSVLADWLILFALRVPIAWFVLTLLGLSVSFVRVAEVSTVAYMLTRLTCQMIVLTFDHLPVVNIHAVLAAALLIWVGILLLSARLLHEQWRRSAIGLLGTTAIHLGIESLLTSTRLI